MTYENIKSIILVILVCFSVLLTWSIWTYQPNYEMMKKANTVQEVAISAKKDVKKIIKPDKIYYHYSKDKHIGTIDSNEIDRVITEISRWNFVDFEDVSAEIKSFPTFIHQAESAVILFPDSIPIELYRTIIEIKDKKLPDFRFDRIVIHLEETEKEQGFVYFISSEDKQAFRSYVPASFVQNFKNAYFKNAEYSLNFGEYFPYKVSNERTLFLPIKETKMLRYQYLSNPLEPEKFKNALFRNPSFVQKNHQTLSEEFTDGSSLMRVNFDKNTISYVNPVEGHETISSKNLLKRSIDFVNEHGGWTDNYRYVEMDEMRHRVLFRLYDAKGYPVFSEDNRISEISQTWGQSEINEYLRSNFSLGIRTESTEIDLSSGQTVLERITGMDGFESEKLQDLIIGYTMIKDAQTRLVYLEPSWYYQYNDSWRKVSVDETGGDIHGLE
ncbi:hypothetical protein BGM26_20250 [Bacillus sp. FJAT-29790]|uniref:YycH family regulatory protein n=1 Tax=Bacillus sp. FJAT-29790 TaxID=1895002 RepID=UPI001C248B53|nr:two-component system activity regulator YycH [Bacillus sp. FJAT-29790]MBU8881259.1 hypothetical protein [Bacillus sp. FJAT-29790]